jgi:hypothetical protein
VRCTSAAHCSSTLTSVGTQGSDDGRTEISAATRSVHLPYAGDDDIAPCSPSRGARGADPGAPTDTMPRGLMSRIDTSLAVSLNLLSIYRYMTARVGSPASSVFTHHFPYGIALTI